MYVSVNVTLTDTHIIIIKKKKQLNTEIRKWNKKIHIYTCTLKMVSQ